MLLMVLSVMILWAQRGGGGGAAGGVMGMVCSCGIGLFWLAVVGGTFAGVWKTFEKAGEPGWAAIVPIYNWMIMSKIAGRGETYGLMVLIPCVGFIFAIIILIDFCKKFDVGGGFVAGLILLGPIFWPMMGFGSTRFLGGSGAGRRRAVDDDDDSPRASPRRRDDDDEDRVRKPRRDDY